MIEIHDTTNDKYAVTQVTAIHDSSEPFFTEFGYMDNFSTNNTSTSGLGVIGVGYSTASGGDIEQPFGRVTQNGFDGVTP